MNYTEIFEQYYSDGPKPKLATAEGKAWEIIQDLSGRSGLGNEWDMIDDDIKDEIFQEYVDIISAE